MWLLLQSFFLVPALRSTLDQWELRRVDAWNSCGFYLLHFRGGKVRDHCLLVVGLRDGRRMLLFLVHTVTHVEVKVEMNLSQC